MTEQGSKPQNNIEEDVTTVNIPGDDERSALDKRLNTLVLIFSIVAIAIVVAGAGYLWNQSSGQVSLSVLDKEIAQVKGDVYGDKGLQTNPNGHIRLAELYMKNGQEDEAIGELKIALRYGKDHPRALLDLGTIYYNQNKNEEAITTYKKIIKNLATGDLAKVNELLGKTYYNLGLAYYDEKDYENALTNFGLTLLINQSDADSFYNVGLTLYKMASYDTAIRSFQTALQFVPDYVDAHLGLAKTYEALGELKKAKAEYEFVRGVDPENEDAKEGLERVK